MQPTLCQPASTASVNRPGILLGRRAPPDYRPGSLREDYSAVSFSSHRREKEYGAHDDSTSDEILRRPRLPVTQADGLPRGLSGTAPSWRLPLTFGKFPITLGKQHQSGPVAQLGEHMVCNHGVASSILARSTNQFKGLCPKPAFHKNYQFVPHAALQQSMDYR